MARSQRRTMKYPWDDYLNKSHVYQLNPYSIRWFLSNRTLSKLRIWSVHYFSQHFTLCPFKVYLEKLLKYTLKSHTKGTLYRRTAVCAGAIHLVLDSALYMVNKSNNSTRYTSYWHLSYIVIYNFDQHFDLAFSSLLRWINADIRNFIFSP